MYSNYTHCRVKSTRLMCVFDMASFFVKIWCIIWTIKKPYKMHPSFKSIFTGRTLIDELRAQFYGIFNTSAQRVIISKAWLKDCLIGKLDLFFLTKLIFCAYTYSLSSWITRILNFSRDKSFSGKRQYEKEYYFL